MGHPEIPPTLPSPCARSRTSRTKLSTRSRSVFPLERSLSINRILQWARDKFQGYFANSFEDANNLIGGDDFVKSIEQLDSPAVQKERLVAVDELLALYKAGQVTF